VNEISNVLSANEQVIWQEPPKYSAYMTSAFIGLFFFSLFISFFVFFTRKFIFFFIPVVVLILGLVVANLSYNRTYYALTNKRAIVQSGIIGRDFRSIDYDQIKNASINVGLIDMLFKVGSLRIFTGEIVMQTNSKGGNHMAPRYDTFGHVENPYDTLKLLQDKISTRKANIYGGKDK